MTMTKKSIIYAPRKGHTPAYGLQSTGLIEARRTRVAKMFFDEEKTVKEIAEMEKLSALTIYKDIGAIRAELYEDRMWSAHKYINLQLAELEFVEDQAKEAWFRSIGTNKKTQSRLDPAGNVIEKVVSKENMIGDPRFLGHIQSVIDRRARLLGLDAPQTFVVDTMESRLVGLIKDGRITFDMLARDVGVNVAAKFFNLAGLEVPNTHYIEGEIIDNEADDE